VTGVVDDWSPDDVLLVELEDDVDDVDDVDDADDDPAVEAPAVALPGMVWAPIAANKPTPRRALTAAPVVRRLRRRIPASRARTLT
jgi:hypothetical protein